MTSAVRTTCPYCGVGCGIIATRKASGEVGIAGDPEHPANLGRLCTKGSALGETLALDDRVLHPLIRGERAPWDEALGLVAARFAETITRHGPDSVAFYVSGQLLTEDYYVANKLMKGFIGSANIDTNSRLCMASSVAGHKRAFGSDTVPGSYEDLELADLVVLVGSNLAWCHPVLFQRLSAARAARGTRIVVIDPRRTDTCEIADLHLALKSGSDVALFNGLLTHLASVDAFDRRYMNRHAGDPEAALAAAASLSAADVTRITGLDPTRIEEFYRLFAATPRTVTVYSQGVNQSTAGTDKVNAIINCHLATGRIGRPGMGPFSVTGQPNAMGGRETGGLANMLAAHMEIDNPAHRRIVQSFWRAPRLAEKPGLKAVDLFHAVGDGRIKALWIMSTNPVDSMPAANVVRAAIERCPFVVVSDVIRHTDTTALAHVLLPSSAWGEKNGTVTNSERRISRQRAFLAPPGEARPDWWQLAQVGRRMGFADAFDYESPAAIFAEYAQLTGIENAGTRDLDISACGAITEEAYDSLAPFQWPYARDTAEASETRFFGDGGFYTPDGRARFIATPYRPPATATTPRFPMLLNTGRIRDQWHTMTRTAKTARLMHHFAEPYAEIHPVDAERMGITPSELVMIVSPQAATVVVRAFVSDRAQAGSVFVPLHWTDQMASSARIDALIGSDVDPVSGQPELKHMPVRVSPFAAAWYAYSVSIAKPSLETIDYWALARAKSGWSTEMAGLDLRDDWGDLAQALIDQHDSDSAPDILAYHDSASGQHRFAAFNDNQLIAALFVAPGPVSVARRYLADQLGMTFDNAAARYRLLAGRVPNDRPDPGPIVCNCFEVGRNEILTAIVSGKSATIDAVGAETRAGTNCGSCRTEIGKLIHASRVQKAG
jgi:assimilatory nitrate reductase catalytic subunit